MKGTAQAFALHAAAVTKVRAKMRTDRIDGAKPSLGGAKDHDVLSHRAHRLHRADGQLSGRQQAKPADGIGTRTRREFDGGHDGGSDHGDRSLKMVSMETILGVVNPGDRDMDASESIPFATRDELEKWLKSHHASKRELWVRIFKKESGTPSVTWNDCVVVAIAWGWIDGQRKSLDDVSFVQRLTPRRAKSNWSKKNCEHAERLIAEGRMQPSGLVHVEAAQKDGRWEQAYAGSAEMVIPDDFLAAVKKNPAAKKFFAGLDRRNLYAIYHRVATAKRPETRQKRIAAIVAQLAEGKAFH